MALTPYEERRLQQRRPAPAQTGRATVKWNELNDELLCPICRSYMRNTSVTPCLHRYCKECIEQAMRQTAKTCPLCNFSIKSHRLLRRDPKFDGIIRAVLGDDLGLYDRKMESAIAKYRESSDMSTLTKSLQGPGEGPLLPARRRRRSDDFEWEDEAAEVEAPLPPRGGYGGRPRGGGKAPRTGPCDSGLGYREVALDKSRLNVHVILEPLPNEILLPRLERRFLVVGCGATVGHLKVYLEKFAFKHVRQRSIKLLSRRSGDRFSIEPDGQFLSLILAEVRSFTEPFTLYYQSE